MSKNGFGADLPASEDQCTASNASDMAIPASPSDHRSAEPGLVRGRDLHPDAPRGFLYLVAIMDWASRKVLAWRLSNTMDTEFCVAALEEAIARYGRPDIFNTDQGSQFTSFAFTTTLKDAGIRISMDGRGRWMDNVFIERLWRSLKYECRSTSMPSTPAVRQATRDRSLDDRLLQCRATSLPPSPAGPPTEVYAMQATEEKLAA